MANFFVKKAGFISREWFPCFANYRRDGYNYVTGRYCEEPEVSRSRILEHAEELYPAAEGKHLRKVIK